MLRRILSLFLPAMVIGATEPPIMKTISYRGGVITFRIPTAWKEEYKEQGGGTFYDEQPESGTLRLNIISFKAPEGKLPIDGYHFYTAKPAKIGETISKTEQNDGIKFSKKQIEEDGEKLVIYTWDVAHCSAHDALHVAIFTWTILESQDGVQKFMKEVEILTSEISKSRFHDDL